MDYRRNPEDDRDTKTFRALVEAMGDPFRSRILFAVAESPDGLTVGQLARMLDASDRRVRYHLDRLRRQGLLVVAEETKRRGMIERRYRAERLPMISNEAMELVGEVQSRKVAAQVLKAIILDAATAAAAGTLGTRGGHATVRMPGNVDQQGWKELAVVFESALVEVQTVLERAQRRLAVGEEEPIRTMSALLLFEAPHPPPGPGA